MASTLTFYTPYGFSRTVVVSASNTNTGAQYSMHHLNDGFLESTWKQDFLGTGIEIVFDTTSAYSVDCVGWWIANPSADWSTIYMSFSWSDNGTIWTTPINNNNIPVNNAGDYLWFIDLPTVVTKRYWKITFFKLAGDFPALLELAHIFLMKKHVINSTGEFPESKVPEYFNTETRTKAGHRAVTRDSRTPIYHFKKNITVFDPDDIEEIETIYRDCNGSLIPFIYQPGTLPGDAFVCRFDKDTPTWVDNGYRERTYTLEFSTLHHIGEGLGY